MAVDGPETTLAWNSGVDYSRSQQNYVRTMHRVIQDSDVVIFVLDARDPEGCRCPTVEAEIRKRELEGKKFIFLLNKTDLVPKSNSEAWLRYLRHIAPTVAFRASTQEQRDNISSKTSSALLRLLKSFKQPSRTLVVGVIGYPNVGKSSVINSLKRSKVCAVGAEPGWTKDMQTIQVERGIKLLDSPGIIFDPDGANSQSLALRNVLKTSDLADPVSVAEMVFQRVTSEEMCKQYKLPQQNSPNFQQFLVQLAMVSGRLLKAGIPDVENAARSIIQDWNSNKLPFLSEPPKLHESSLPGPLEGARDVGDSKIITGGFAPAFDLEGLLCDDSNPRSESQEENDRMSADEDDLEPETPNTTSRKERKPKKRVSKRARLQRDLDTSYEEAFMADANPLSRKLQKKQNKHARKTAIRVGRTDLGLEQETSEFLVA